MLSSISNSDNHWGRTLWLLLFMLVVSVGAYELALKKGGHRPSIESDQDLWSFYRAQIQNNPNALVILGASRAQLGLDTHVMRQRFPEKDVIELTLNGQYPMATLEALAQDESFTGVVWLSIVAQSLEPVYWDMQAPNNQYFEQEASFYKSLDAYISAWLQSKWRLLHPTLRLSDWVEFAFSDEQKKAPFYVIEHLDLSKSGDYSEQDLTQLVTHFVEQKRQNYLEQSAMSLAVWEAKVNRLKLAVNSIENRGGSVVLIRMPTDKGHWQLDEANYPKAQYWDQLSDSGLRAVHFKDWPALSDFDLPDSSHLDQKDAPPFTEQLIQVLCQNFKETLSCPE